MSVSSDSFTTEESFSEGESSNASIFSSEIESVDSTINELGDSLLNTPSAEYSLSATPQSMSLNTNYSASKGNYSYPPHRTAVSWYHSTRRLVKRMHKLTTRDVLPWRTDFLARSRMELCLKPGEMLLRLNLNVPYYYANYLILSYAIVLPFLLLYDPLFLFVTGLCICAVYKIVIQRRTTGSLGDSMKVFHRRVTYRTLAHCFFAAYLFLFAFRQGAVTFILMCVLVNCIIIPHAVCRRPTFFDEEDLEKCRPMLVKYAGLLLVLLLAYIEGETAEDEFAENEKVVAKERERILRNVGRGMKRSSA